MHRRTQTPRRPELKRVTDIHDDGVFHARNILPFFVLQDLQSALIGGLAEEQGQGAVVGMSACTEDVCFCGLLWRFGVCLVGGFLSGDGWVVDQSEPGEFSCMRFAEVIVLNLYCIIRKKC